ncbi:signal peptidase II [Streptomyces sp. Ncost-T6T-2b]|nr:signal peptidase II [Streptomyces sp. Ncost-T6T-2b]
MAEAERIIGTPDNPEAEGTDEGGSTAADAAVNAAGASGRSSFS